MTPQIEKSLQKTRPVSYREKKPYKCPLCSTEILREKIHTARGRLISGEVTRELRRIYQSGKGYGPIYPPAYSILVCPKCLYAAFLDDFRSIEADEKMRLEKLARHRREEIQKIVGAVDFREDRNLILGAASYILAIECYQQKNSDSAPTPKKAICSLRGAWLFSDLHHEFPQVGFDKVMNILYAKAVHYYQKTFEVIQSGKEPQKRFINILGPDTDKNWGLDGAIYISSYLRHQHYEQLAKDPQASVKLLEQARINVSKLYAMGKFSFSKPSMLIEYSRKLYEDMTKTLEKLTGRQLSRVE